MTEEDKTRLLESSDVKVHSKISKTDLNNPYENPLGPTFIVRTKYLRSSNIFITKNERHKGPFTNDVIVLREGGGLQIMTEGKGSPNYDGGEGGV